jgi:hypothetical protein
MIVTHKKIQRRKKQVNFVLIGLTLEFEYSDLSILVVSSFGHQTDNGSFKWQWRVTGVPKLFFCRVQWVFSCGL